MQLIPPHAVCNGDFGPQNVSILNSATGSHVCLSFAGAPCTSQPGLPNSPIPHTPVNTPVNRQRHPTLSPAVGPSRTPDPISASSFRQLLIDAGNSPTAHQPNHAAGQGNANEDTAGRQQPDTMVASCTELCSSSGSMMPGMQEKSVAPATGGLVEYSCDDSVQPKGVGRNVAWRQAGLRGTAERTGSEPCGLDVAAFLPPSLSPRQARMWHLFLWTPMERNRMGKMHMFLAAKF